MLLSSKKGKSTESAGARQLRLAIAWNGLPVYAARLLRAVIANHEVTVIGTRPAVPFEGIEDHLGGEITWIDETADVSWSGLGLPVPDLFIHTGWRNRAFNRLGLVVHQNGGMRVSMVDNNWHGTFRQMLGMVVFRLRMRRQFDRVIVPGRSGFSFMKRMGMPSQFIHTGLYGADPLLFPPGCDCAARAKRILFVGQFIERKGITELLEAWRLSGAANHGWELRCFGKGPMESILRATPGIHVGGFIQADRLSDELRQARVLVLPSRREHWGVVVHEAALSGCALVLSDAVGAASDLLDTRNGHGFRAGHAAGLSRCFERMVTGNDEWFSSAGQHSLQLAASFGPERWAKVFEDILEGVSSRP